MKIPIAIEPGTETTAFGVVVPDMPGCFSAGYTLEQAIENAREAIELWCKAVNKDGDLLPVTKTLAEHQADGLTATLTTILITRKMALALSAIRVDM